LVLFLSEGAFDATSDAGSAPRTAETPVLDTPALEPDEPAEEKRPALSLLPSPAG